MKGRRRSTRELASLFLLHWRAWRHRHVWRKGLLSTHRTGAAAGKVYCLLPLLHSLQKLPAKISHFIPTVQLFPASHLKLQTKVLVAGTVSNDEGSVPAGNKLGDSCHACHHAGVKSEKQFPCVGIPTEMAASAQGFLKSKSTFSMLLFLYSRITAVL